MTQERTHSEKTSADAITIAFDYQYYYFLYKLFSLEVGQSVGLEVKDDVHTELDNDFQLLIQLKHSVQTKKDGEAINFTTLDTDLWHTLYNWCKVIIDKNDGRNNKEMQIMFLKKTFFILVTNKSQTNENKFINILNKFKLCSINIKSLRDEIEKIDTTNNDIKKYKSELLNLSDEVLSLFLKNIEFDLEEKDLITKCKNTLKSNMIPEKNIDDLFKKLDSSIREENYKLIKDNKKIIINFDTYYKKYRIYYDEARNTDLKIKKFELILPDNLIEQNFIRQLIDINDISESDIDSIIKYTKFKLQIQNNISSWLEKSEITNDEVKDFEEDTLTIWENEFKRNTKGNLTMDEIIERAQLIIDELRKEKLKIANLDLDIRHSNGQFYSLCDNYKLGLRKDWKEIYVK